MIIDSQRRPDHRKAISTAPLVSQPTAPIGVSAGGRHFAVGCGWGIMLAYSPSMVGPPMAVVGPSWLTGAGSAGWPPRNVR